MKGLILFICFLFTILPSLKAQENTTQSSKHSIGISSTFIGNANIVYFQTIDGGAAYEGEGYYTIALNYLYSINKVLDIGTGIEYGKYSVNITPNPPPPHEGTPFLSEYEMLNIPITIRANFAKYFFVNGGIQFDFDLKNEYTYTINQGMGAMLGLGFNYTFKFNLSLFVNPYVKAHNLINFSEYNVNNDIKEAGIRIGAFYRF